MDKRLLVTFAVLTGVGFLYLATQNSQNGAEKKGAGEPVGVESPARADNAGADGPNSSVSGPVDGSQVYDLESTVEVRNQQGDDGFLLEISNIGATVKSARMLRKQFDQAENDKRYAPLPEDLRGQIPDSYYEAGPLEIVSTWPPTRYPFHTRFDRFEHEGEVRRVLRDRVEGGTIDPQATDELRIVEVKKGEKTHKPNLRSAYPAVQKNDTIEILEPASLAGKGPYTIEAVRGDALIEVTPHFAVDSAVEGVVFRVVTKGSFSDVYARDMRYTLIESPKQADSADGDYVYVWPDPDRDESDVFLERRLRVSGAYSLDMDVIIHNFSAKEVKEQISLSVEGFQPPVKGGGLFSGPPPDQRNALCYATDSLTRATVKEMVEEPMSEDWRPVGKVGWIGVESRYFLLAAVPLNIAHSQCRMAAQMVRPPEAVLSSYVGTTKTTVVLGATDTCVPDWMPSQDDRPRCSALYTSLGVQPGATDKAIEATLLKLRKTLKPDAYDAAKKAARSLRGRRAVTHSYRLYLGPKDLDYLSEAGEGLTESVNFWIVGVIARPMVWLLGMFFSLVGHWGVAIILLTVLVKLVLLPVTQKSFTSMQAMQQLKPEMDELKKKYGNDRQKMNEEMMALYKRHKVNPLGGCLPMLFQMPVWIALYRAIYSTVELYQAPLFGWIQDLSSPDPYYVLPLVLGAAMFLQQKFTPTSMDSTQAKMMTYFMPVMFTLFMLFLPSGLVLYIFVNTLLTMVQQLYIRRHFGEPQKKAAIKA